MKIAVSACLLGRNCRYDGQNCRDEQLLKALEGHEIVEICPECAAGLPVPRTPMELKEGRVTSKNGDDLTEAMEAAVEKTVQTCLDEGVEMAVLMERSPTCGVTTIYDGSFDSTLINGQGLLTKRLTEEGISCLSKELFTVVKRI